MKLKEGPQVRNSRSRPFGALVHFVNLQVHHSDCDMYSASDLYNIQTDHIAKTESAEHLCSGECSKELYLHYRIFTIILSS